MHILLKRDLVSYKLFYSPVSVHSVSVRPVSVHSVSVHSGSVHPVSVHSVQDFFIQYNTSDTSHI